jgi:hypothetical protein
VNLSEFQEFEKWLFVWPKGQPLQEWLAYGSTFITKHIAKYWSLLSIAGASLDPIDYVSVCKPSQACG